QYNRAQDVVQRGWPVEQVVVRESPQVGEDAVGGLIGEQLGEMARSLRQGAAIHRRIRVVARACLVVLVFGHAIGSGKYEQRLSNSERRAGSPVFTPATRQRPSRVKSTPPRWAIIARCP